MKKLDIHIIKRFLGTFILATSLLILIVVAFDVSEKIDDFLEKQAPLNEIIFTYYLNFIPYFVNLFSPLFTFIAVVFFTAKMASDNEFVAILSSGINFKRVLVPYFISALILALMTFLLANFVIPHANKKRITFQNTYLKNPSTYRERNTHLQISPNTFAYVESYNDETNTGYHFSLEKARKGTIYYKLSSDFIKWDSISKKWEIENYYIRLINGMEEKIKTGKQIDTVLNINPADFIQKIKNVGTMGFSQLRSFIKEEKLKGSSNIQFYEVEKHKRIAFPFSTIILTLIGVSLSSRKQRGGIGLSLSTGLTVSFAFILFMQVSTTFSTMGNLNPVIGVWMPNILFGVISIYLLKIVPK